MFSKAWKCVATLASLLPVVLIAVFLSACDLPIYEEPPPKKQLKFEAGAGECMDQAPEVVEKFFKGKGDSKRVAATWDCAVKAVESFTRSARGEEPGRYSPRELANFFETYLLGGKEISDELLKEAMRIKPLFVGGSEEYLTLEELEETKEFFKFLKEQSLNLLPHMKVLSFNWTPAPSELQGQWKQFEKATAALHQFTKAIGSHIADNDITYDLRSFVKFMEEAEAIYKGKWKFAGEISKYLPLVNQIKVALSGGEAFKLSPQEWHRLFVLGQRSYSLYQRYYYFTAQENTETTQVHFLIDSLGHLTSMLSEILSQKPNNSISKAEVFKILTTAERHWPELNVSGLLMDEGFRLKELFFGGNQDSLHKNDFVKAQKKLGMLRPLLTDLLPLRSFLTLENVNDLFGTDEARRLQTESAVVLEKTAQRVAEFVEGPYAFSHLVNLIEEVQRLYPELFSLSLGEELKTYLPLIKEFKETFIGAPSGSIEADQWEEFLTALTFAGTEYLEYSYFVGEKATSEQLEEYVFDLTHRGSAWLSALLAKRPEQRLSQQELESLLQRVSEILPGSVYPAGLTQELLSFKSLVLGGPADSLSAGEITRAAKFYSRYRSLWQEAKPYLDYLSLKWNPNASSPAEQHKIKEQAEAFFKKVLSHVQADLKKDYDLEDAFLLLEKLSQYSGGKLDLDVTALREAMPWVRLVNTELLGERGQLIKKSHWQTLLDWGSQAYLSYLQYSYFVTELERSPVRGEGLYVTEALVPRLLDLARSIVSSQPGRLLKIEQITPFLLRLESEGLLPEKVDADFISDLISYVADRLFPSKPLTTGYISLAHLDKLKAEIQDWLMIQKEVQMLYAGVDRRWTRAQVLAIWEARINELKSKSQPVKSHLDMLKAFRTPYPLVHNSTGELWLLVQEEDPLYQASDLLAMNWKRVVINLLFETYSTEPRREGVGLTQAEVEGLFLEVRDFAIRLGFLDPKNFYFATSRFLEANIFPSRANGDGFYNYEEGIEQFTLIASGIKINDRLTPWVIQSCAHRDAIEKLKHNVMVSIHCVRNVFRARMNDITRNMPRMGKAFADHSDEEQIAMLEDIEVAANVVIRPGDLTSMSDVELLPHIMQYLENVFITYDRNRDGVFDIEESLRAFPVYKNLLKEFSPLKGDEDLKAIFTFMLKYGEPPLGAVNIAKFLWWRLRPGSWQVEVDRRQLAKMMAEIRHIINGKGENLEGLRSSVSQP